MKLVDSVVIGRSLEVTQQGSTSWIGHRESNPFQVCCSQKILPPFIHCMTEHHGLIMFEHCMVNSEFFFDLRQ